MDDKPFPELNKDSLRSTESEFRVISDHEEVYNESLLLAESAKSEILAAMISENSILRNTENLQFFSRKIERENNGGPGGKKFRMHLLVPAPDGSSRDSLGLSLKGIEYRTIESAPLSFAVYDRNTALLVHYKMDQGNKQREQFASAVLTTNPGTAAGLVFCI